MTLGPKWLLDLLIKRLAIGVDAVLDPTRGVWRFIAGPGISISAADNATTGESEVTITAEESAEGSMIFSWDIDAGEPYDQFDAGWIGPPRMMRYEYTIDAVVLVRTYAGTANTTRVDVLVGRLNDDPEPIREFNSIFANDGAKPSVSALDGDYLSSEKTTFTSAALLEDDWLVVEIEAAESYLAGPPQGPDGLRVEVHCHRTPA